MATLAKALAALLKYETERDLILDSGVEELSVGDQRFRHHRLLDLEKMIDKYERMVADLSTGSSRFGVTKFRAVS